jgi:hypothetical protein
LIPRSTCAWSDMESGSFVPLGRAHYSGNRRAFNRLAEAALPGFSRQCPMPCFAEPRA